MKPFLIAALLLAATPALAEDWTMPWQEDASFAAYSTTAESVTGDISISGSDSEKVLSTADGSEIGLSFVEDRSSGWNLNDNEVWPGGVFAIDEDPGALGEHFLGQVFGAGKRCTLAHEVLDACPRQRDVWILVRSCCLYACPLLVFEARGKSARFIITRHEERCDSVAHAKGAFV